MFGSDWKFHWQSVQYIIVNSIHYNEYLFHFSLHCTEVRFASFLSGGFITAIVVNPLERKLEKRTSVHWVSSHLPPLGGVATSDMIDIGLEVLTAMSLRSVKTLWEQELRPARRKWSLAITVNWSYICVS